MNEVCAYCLQDAVTERRGSAVCADCAEAHDYYDNLTTDEMRKEAEMVARYVEETEYW